MIDVLSPCVTFNDHEGSTKSYAYAKDHDEPLGEVSFVPFFEDISVEYDPGTTTEVKMHDGSKLYLKKVAEDYNPTDKLAAMRLLHETARRGEFATGVLYVEPDKEDFLAMLNIVDEPLATLPLERVRPGESRARRGDGVAQVNGRNREAMCRRSGSGDPHFISGLGAAGEASAQCGRPLQRPRGPRSAAIAGRQVGRLHRDARDSRHRQERHRHLDGELGRHAADPGDVDARSESPPRWSPDGRICRSSRRARARSVRRSGC